MTTVLDVKEIFSRKGFHFEHLPSEHLPVESVQVVERHVRASGDFKAVLKIRYVDDKGKKVSDLFSCEGRMPKDKLPPPIDAPKPSELGLLPLREGFEFESDAETAEYLKLAISHLLRGKGYSEAIREGSDLYFEKSSRGFFINVTQRFDEAGLKKASHLIELRMKHGSENGYGLVAPAFQDPLGVSLLEQEHWLRRNGEALSTHRIGVYGVNNRDPNQIFPFTVYPQKDKELMSYLVYMRQQWSVMRDKYVQYRAERAKPQGQNRLALGG